MAVIDPTITELDAQFAADCALFWKERLQGITQANPYITLLDTANQNLEGDYSGQRASAQAAHRALVAATISDSAARSLILPALLNYGASDEVESDAKDAPGLVDDLYDYMQSIAVAAQGTLTQDTNPTDGDTITIDGTTYRFKSTMALANDVKIGASNAATQASLVATVNGTGTDGTDFYVGTTTPHATVKMGDFDGSDQSVLTARDKGTAGNSIATTETYTAGTNVFDAATLGTTTAGVAPRTVQSRVMSFGAISAAADNVTNATIKRWTVNKDGHSLESCWADTITVEVTSAGFGNGGAKRAALEIRGRSVGIDRLTENGAAAYNSTATLKTSLRELTARDTQGITNADFNNLTGATDVDAAALTALGSWTIVTGTVTNWAKSMGTAGTNYYRDLPGRSTMRGLDINESFKLRQRFNRTPVYGTPYEMQLIYKTEASCDGTLRLRVGSRRVTVNVAGVTGFGILAMSRDRFSYAENWYEYDANTKGCPVEIDLTNNTTGNIILCELIIAPATLHDSIPFVAVPAATGTTTHVPFHAATEDKAEGDNWSFADSETGAIVQTVVMRATRKMLPHVDGTETITEPVVS